MDLKPITCAADGCEEVFEPLFPGNIYHSKTCSARMRMKRKRERDRKAHSPNGGGPGGKRQPMLFQRSELHRRKPAKATQAPRPKPGDLFPEDGTALYASFGGAVSYAKDGSVTDNDRYSKYSVKSSRRRPPQSVSQNPEKPLAA